jgi:hypothetical protein
MNGSPSKNPSGWLATVVVLLIVLTALAPTLIALGHVLLPLVIAGGVVVVIVRLVFFHTRDF